MGAWLFIQPTLNTSWVPGTKGSVHIIWTRLRRRATPASTEGKGSLVSQSFFNNISYLYKSACWKGWSSPAGCMTAGSEERDAEEVPRASRVVYSLSGEDRVHAGDEVDAPRS